VIRNLILSFLIIAAVAPLAADEAAAPLLFIERIEVRNAKRVSPDVVIAESRLREGREYSEAELRDAATRLGRLPFLLNVDFALEKGSERGRHVLVLTINETKPFFFLIDATPYWDDDPFLDIDYSNNRSGAGSSLILGGRWFVGRRGAFHVGFSTIDSDREFSREYASLAVGYTQYDLFGTRAFATLNLKKPIEGYGEGQLSPQLVVGIPVSANQTVTLQFDETRFAGEDRVILGVTYPERFGQRVITARWSYDTTNEPFFPTRGTLLQVAPMYGWTDGADVFSVSTVFPGPTTVEYGSFHSDFYGVEASATQYYELTDRDSVWGNVRGELAREAYVDKLRDVQRTANYGGVGLGYSHSFWTNEERAGGGDSRFELTARYSNRTRDDESPSFFSPGNDVRQVSAAWLRRTSWGTLRLGGGYAW
jgi:outer membrane protein assembly factor BamA